MHSIWRDADVAALDELGRLLDGLIEVGEPLDMSGAWRSNTHTEPGERRHLVAPHRTAARTVLIER